MWRITASHCYFALAIFLTLVVYGVVFILRDGSSPSPSSPLRTSSSASPLSLDLAVRKLAASDGPTVLNAHVIPHTHDDVGWRKTVDQYYHGWNASIDARGAVHSILSTSIAALTQHEARTFTYVEQKFFSTWWEEQADAVKDTVRFLVANRQLTFVNGGWCMHDEAASHYMGMLDQTTTGHQFLLRELGVVPRTGWQLDPFGHSATQASLLTDKVGFDALYFGRIDYQDLALRKAASECEGLWNASSSSSDSTIFWGLTGSYGGNYGPPAGFMFDVLFGDDERLVSANETRLHERIVDFLGKIKVQSDQTKGNHIMLTMGTDFTFQEAHVDYSNYDLLIGTIMNYQHWNQLNVSAMFGPRFDRVNIFYSNPDYYTEQKYKETKRQREAAATSSASSTADDSPTTALPATVNNWTIKSDDFFPYSDGPNSFWTGYFTSRAGFKRLERVASSFLLAARQIDAISSSSSLAAKIDTTTFESSSSSSSSSDNNNPLFVLEDAVGVAQHHDAVSGTGKQHVADDYSKRLSAGIHSAALHVVQKLKSVMLASVPSSAKDAFQQQQLTNLDYCPLLNETKCSISEDATASNDTLVYVIVYNPLATNRSSVIRLPVASEASFRVERIEEGEQNKVSIIRSLALTDEGLHAVAGDDTTVDDVKHVLIFGTGDLPPIGAVAFRIAKEPDGPSTTKVSPMVTAPTKENMELSNGQIAAVFDSSTGMLTGLESADGASFSVDQSWGYYTSYDSAMDGVTRGFGSASNTEGGDGVTAHGGDHQNSGAYIFRPSEPKQKLKLLKPKANAAVFLNTSVGMEVHASFQEPWLKQVTRVTKGLPYIEVEYTVGPIPIGDGRGKEIVGRLTTPIKSNGVFYTDSNGREFQARKRDSRPSWDLKVFQPVAGNYYPVNAAIYIEDMNASLAVLVDRSQGGASLLDGSIELMVQRRTVADDQRGVDEPLNETSGGMSPYPPWGDNQRIGDGVVYRGKHRIMIGKGSVGASLARSAMDGAFAEPLVFVGSWPASEPVVFDKASFAGLQTSLPANLMLVTLMRIPGRTETTFLLRLGHQYGVGEDEELSKPVNVDLTKLLVGYSVTSVEEKTLSGNQKLSHRMHHRLDWTGEGSSNGRVAAAASTTNITIAPMEIRTFELVVSSLSLQSAQ